MHLRDYARHLISLKRSKLITLRSRCRNIMWPIWIWYRAKNRKGPRLRLHRRLLSLTIQAELNQVSPNWLSPLNLRKIFLLNNHKPNSWRIFKLRKSKDPLKFSVTKKWPLKSWENLEITLMNQFIRCKTRLRYSTAKCNPSLTESNKLPKTLKLLILITRCKKALSVC